MTSPTARALVAATFRQRRRLAALVAWTFVGSLPTFVTGQALARATDDGFLAGRPATGVAWLALVAVTIPVGAWGARRTYLGVGRLVEPLRDSLVHLVVDDALRRSMGPAMSRDRSAVARLTQHVETVRETVAGLFLLVLAFVGAVVAALVGILSLAPEVLPFVVVPLVLSLAVFVAALPRMTRQQRRLLLADEELAERAASTATGLRDIVACSAEERLARHIAVSVDEQTRAAEGMARMQALRTVVVSAGARLPLILLLIFATRLLDQGLSAGALLGALAYLAQGLEPALSSVVSGVGAPLAQLLVTIDRLDAGERPWAVPSGTPAVPSGPPAHAGVVLDDVTFRYRAAAEPVVARLSLDIGDGEHLAVVGPSGAGKSTLSRLIVGMLLPQSGEVLVGGRPAHTIRARHRVLVPQQAYVFRGVLEENVRYLNPDASPEAVDRAIDAVGLGDLAVRLGGCAAEVDPRRLSAGERQLIVLARAYLSRARLVVLDEATCHLDPTAEATAEQAFSDRGGTLVVVAHRISSARRAERILVVDGIETLVGDHDQLVDRSALYRDLVGHWLEPVSSITADRRGSESRRAHA